MSAGARLHIDWTRCDGHGGCSDTLPELLVSDEWGFPRSRASEKEPTVPAHLRPAARAAVRSCPLMALSLLPAADVRRGETR
jgi:ferredoxin